MEPVHISYPKIGSIERDATDLVGKWVRVDEKLDGSNVSVVKDVHGNVWMQSRSTIIDPDNMGMFKPFVDYVIEQELDRKLEPGTIVFGEMVMNQGKIRYPKTVPFSIFDVFRIDVDNKVVFGINSALNSRTFANTYGLVHVPVLIGSKLIKSIGDLTELAEMAFNMTADPNEGVVIKTYDMTLGGESASTGKSWTHYSPVYGLKRVREGFKERKAEKIVKEDVSIGTMVTDVFVNEPRVRKAIARLNEQGNDNPKLDAIIRVVIADVLDEELDTIKEMLYTRHKKEIGSAIGSAVARLPREDYS